MDQKEQLRNQQIIDALDFTRGLIIGAVEIGMADQKTWPTTRSQLLKILGDRGLEGKLRSILGMAAIPHSDRLT